MDIDERLTMAGSAASAPAAPAETCAALLDSQQTPLCSALLADLTTLATVAVNIQCLLPSVSRH